MLNILDIKLKKTTLQAKELIEFRVNISYKISNEYFENISLFKSWEVLLKKISILETLIYLYSHSYLKFKKFY